jgi:hypothetical protein
MRLSLFTFTAENGVPFLARLVKKGDQYGLNGCLAHEDARPMVEFFDRRFDLDKWLGVQGQFVSRYYVETLVAHDQSYGLLLDGGVPDWSIGADSLCAVRRWLLDELAPEQYLRQAYDLAEMCRKVLVAVKEETKLSYPHAEKAIADFALDRGVVTENMPAPSFAMDDFPLSAPPEALEAEGQFKVYLATCGNIDHDEDPDEKLYGAAENRWVPVRSLKEASKFCREFIDSEELGSGNWAGGQVVESNSGKMVAAISYNGRVWLPEASVGEQPIAKKTSSLGM